MHYSGMVGTAQRSKERAPGLLLLPLEGAGSSSRLRQGEALGQTLNWEKQVSGQYL